MWLYIMSTDEYRRSQDQPRLRPICIIEYSTRHTPNSCFSDLDCNHPHIRSHTQEICVNMALIVISGYPSSGKSTRSEQIKTDFERRIRENNGVVDGIREVVIVNDIDYDGRRPYDSESTDCIESYEDFLQSAISLIMLSRSTQLRLSLRETRSSARLYPGYPSAVTITSSHPRRAKLYQGIPVSTMVCGEGGEGPASYVLRRCAGRGV